MNSVIQFSDIHMSIYNVFIQNNLKCDLKDDFISMR